MELKQKGSSAYIALKQLRVIMKWTTAADFDLAATYKTKDGKDGIVYFGDLGNANEFPFIQLSGDEGVGDKGGDNEESMLIAKLDDMQKIWIFCWDYGMIKSGGAARFKESDVRLEIIDNSGNTMTVEIDAGDLGNVCCIATIDNSSPMGAQLINTSAIGTLKGLQRLEQLQAVVAS